LNKLNSNSNPKIQLELSNKFQLHPDSWKHLQRGHQWVIKDSFTEKFPKSADLISFKNWIFIHDPDHKKVKARLWKRTDASQKYTEDIFWNEFEQRLEKALAKRKNEYQDRDNVYLVFEESDQLPGLRILLLKDYLVITAFSGFWTKFKNQVIQRVASQCKQEIFFEARVGPQETDSLHGPEDIRIEEFGVQYSINLNNLYDFGIYTDMSGVRKKLSERFLKRGRFLNLFAYTGAYSLIALKNGCDQVVSVDMSKKNMNWLEQNLELNNFSKEKHRSICKDSLKAIELLQKESAQFETILCDAPSSFSNKKKRFSLFQYLKIFLPEALKLLTDNGNFILFCNTHNLNRNAFKKKIEGILPRGYSIQNKQFRMVDDCDVQDGFEEMDYLKGLVIQRN
jgi:23S rRNA (cytosine1962-C5)-methyltransferase